MWRWRWRWRQRPAYSGGGDSGGAAADVVSARWPFAGRCALVDPQCRSTRNVTNGPTMTALQAVQLRWPMLVSTKNDACSCSISIVRLLFNLWMDSPFMSSMM